MQTNYNTDLQQIFLSFMLSEASLFTRVQNIYNPENFDKSLRKAATFLSDHITKYTSIPDKSQLFAMSGTKLEIIDDIDKGHIEWFLNEFEQFTRHEELKRAILKSADLLESGDFGPVEQMIKNAVQISLTRNMGTDYFADPRQRLNKLRDNNGQCSTGWKDLDNLLYGGFNKGELNIFCGLPSAGKSIFLQNLACNWMTSGLNGVYITLELKEELVSMRLDSMLTGISSKNIFKQLDDVELTIGMLGKKSGKLRIKYMPPQSTSNDIRAYLKELKIQTGIEADFLLTDYLDLMSPAGQKISASDIFTKDKLVAEELRNLGYELNLLNSSASQINRSGVDQIEFDYSNIAGGISKVNTADNLFGIFSSRAMKERGVIQLQPLKTRNSAGGVNVDLAFNVDSLRISDLDEGAKVQTGSDIMKQLKIGSSLKSKEPESGKVITPSNKLQSMLDKLKHDKG